MEQNLSFRTLREYGFEPQQIVACGGPLKSQLWTADSRGRE